MGVKKASQTCNHYQCGCALPVVLIQVLKSESTSKLLSMPPVKSVRIILSMVQFYVWEIDWEHIEWVPS